MPSSKPTLGVNDLQSQCPDITKEWHSSKNGDLKPMEVTRSSRKKVWWQCRTHPDHEWNAKVADRSNGIGCPICSNKKVLAGFNDLQSTEPDLAKEWHQTRNGGLKPTEVTRSSSKKVWWQCSTHPDHEWDTKVADRSNGKGCPICSGNKTLEGFNDLQSLAPEVAKEWHQTRNGDLKPTDISKGSSKKVWWQCRTHPDHEWDTKVADRSNGKGCPICSGNKTLEGFNDLQSLAPEVAKEWHQTRNGDLKPTDISKGSSKKVWWQCRTHPDHEWVSSIDSRGGQGTGCPICSGKKVLEGFNDLQSLDPDLAKEWNQTRNGDLKPTDISKGSSKKVWWQCRTHPDHEWVSSIGDRTGKGQGCPICSGNKTLEGFNDLQSLAPEVAKEWHPMMNGKLKPKQFSKRSRKKVWWQCSKYPDHEWVSTIDSRTGQGQGCPICAGNKVLAGFNDLQSTEPDLAKEWHPTRNGGLKPTEVTRSSSKKIWWQCSTHPDHEWDAVVASRSTGTGCPICAEYGFNPDKNAWFYLMERPGEQQLGISNVIIDRLRTHELNGWNLIEHTTEPALGQKVLDTEKAFKKWLKDEIGLMDGTTENWSTTKMEVQSLAELKARSGIETDLF